MPYNKYVICTNFIHNRVKGINPFTSEVKRSRLNAIQRTQVVKSNNQD